MEHVETRRRHRGPLLTVASSAAIGGILVVAVALPAIWRLAWPYAALLTVLLLAESVGTAVALVRVRRASMGLAALGAIGVAGLWALSEVWRILPGPDPFLPISSTVGVVGWFGAGLQVLAAVTMLAGSASTAFRTPSRRSQLIGVLTAIPVLTVIAFIGALSIVAAGSGFSGPSIPAATVGLGALRAGQRATVEYCRPDGVALPMDISLPRTWSRTEPAPAVMYVHGGGLVLGDRRTSGLGANLAGNDGALLLPITQRLNSLGFVVASIDYRLTPSAPWRAPLTDAKCAVRFLRARAAALGIDPSRIGVWGSSAGGQLASLLGLAARSAGFDRGEYSDRSSAVQAVVDMFGPPDVMRYGDAGPFPRMILSISLGNSPRVRRMMSPICYVRPGAPPFLILQGRRDSAVLVEQSAAFGRALRAARVPVTMVTVDGAGHGLDTLGQHPPPSELTDRVVRFFQSSLG